MSANLPGRATRSVRVAEIDRRLHAERVTRRRVKVTHRAPLESLPDGVFVAAGERALLVRGSRLYPWSAHGYLEPVRQLVAQTIANVDAAGCDTNDAQDAVDAGDAAYAAGDWLSAFDHYAVAYCRAISGLCG